MTSIFTRSVLGKVADERRRQPAKWGEQNHPNGTGEEFAAQADIARAACEFAFATGEGTWAHILSEEFFEALAEADPVKLREELVQVAAVATSWVECIDRTETSA